MAKTDFIFVVSKREDAGSRLRIYPVAEEMVKRGWRCEVRGVPKGLVGRVGLFLRIMGSDVVLLHKKLFNPLELSVL
ncbi:MAG: HU family DNA-binding protein, partial [Nitrospirota bacterium]